MCSTKLGKNWFERRGAFGGFRCLKETFLIWPGKCELDREQREEDMWKAWGQGTAAGQSCRPGVHWATSRQRLKPWKMEVGPDNVGPVCSPDVSSVILSRNVTFDLDFKNCRDTLVDSGLSGSYAAQCFHRLDLLSLRTALSQYILLSSFSKWINGVRSWKI